MDPFEGLGEGGVGVWEGGLVEATVGAWLARRARVEVVRDGTGGSSGRKSLGMLSNEGTVKMSLDFFRITWPWLLSLPSFSSSSSLR